MGLRDELSRLLRETLSALQQNDPQQAPLSPQVRFTENTVELPVGKGFWATSTPGPEAPVYFEAVDTGLSQVVYWGPASEGHQPVILGLRIQVAESLITEIEMQVIRRPPEGGHPRVFSPEAMLVPNPIWFEAVDLAERAPRSRMIECAEKYLEGILANDGASIPVTLDCVRLENGVQTVLNSTRDEDLGSWGVAAQISSGIFRDIEAARERRVLAIDEERGLIVLAFMFDHPGPVTKSEFRSRFDQPNTMAALEVFKVKNGEIVRIESVLNVFQYGIKSGWEQ